VRPLEPRSPAGPDPRLDNSGGFPDDPAMIDIVQATTPEDMDAVRDLMRAFVAWHRQRHTEDLALIDRYFDAREFEQELAALPGKYAPPKGHLLLARRDGQPVGCVALRDLGEGICEMKRMFVPPALHGQGIGRALADRVLSEAKTAGYERMRLDTSIRQAEAMRLYERAGFVRIEPYYPLPDELKNWLVFMELRL
jgi:GNAT superfamily N-acetyltransferase